MFKNYFKVASRNLRRQKLYSFINIGGLALGIACCVLLFLFVQHEWTYDQFHEKADRIYRVVTAEEQPDGSWEQRALSPAKLGPALEQTFPEIENVVRLASGIVSVERGEQSFEADVLFADYSFAEVFTFPLVSGNPETALNDPNDLVLTRQAAQKYFGTKNPVGGRLSIQFEDETFDFRVSGVVEEVPANSSIQFEAFLPFEYKKYT